MLKFCNKIVFINLKRNFYFLKRGINYSIRQIVYKSVSYEFSNKKQI